jgi:nitroreductase
MNKTINQRKIAHKVNKIFPERWSPRAMSGEKLSDEELFSLFEAARWAPSSFNNQPWRFIYAKKNSEHWNKLFNLLVEFNQQWCENAAVLVVIVSKKTFENNNKPSITHSYDTGSAWMSLALQGSLQGLVVHGMESFDYEKAKLNLKIPKGYKVEAMTAIGKPGEIKDLPEKMQQKEKPSGRKLIKEIVFEGQFPEEK